MGCGASNEQQTVGGNNSKPNSDANKNESLLLSNKLAKDNKNETVAKPVANPKLTASQTTAKSSSARKSEQKNPLKNSQLEIKQEKGKNE